MLEDTFGHTPVHKAFGLGDVYGIGYDEARASRRKVRLGIAGAGGVAQSKYYPAIARLRTIWEPVEVVAFAEPNAVQAEKVQAIWGGHHYPDVPTLLAATEIDGLLVLSPDALHAEHTLAALEAGVPVLVEKPIARTLQDAARMCRVADERGVPLMSVANKRCSPPYRRARQLIADGPVANPALFTAKFNLGYDYVDLFEAGTIHLFDMTRFLMGDVVTVNAVGVNKYRRNRDGYPVDNAVITFLFASDAAGSLTTSSSALSLKPWERVEVYGDHAWLAVEDQHTLTLYDGEEAPTRSWSPVVPNTLLFDEEWGGYMGIVENFLQVIRGDESPVVTGWDGYRAYELAVASHLALARHAAVTLPLDPASADEEMGQWLTNAKAPQ